MRPAAGAAYHLISRISIHALRKECDRNTNTGVSVYSFLFLSTHSVRSATVSLYDEFNAFIAFLSTHSVRSATANTFRTHSEWAEIFLSTHSVRSATVKAAGLCDCCDKFLSTHSVRSATSPHFFTCCFKAISIHALRKECDGVECAIK